MGLDMYAHRVRANSAVAAFAATIPESDMVGDDLAYWRKHPNLHGFMQQLFAERSGHTNPDDFNCVYVELKREDIDRLEQAVLNDELPETSGFFFGQSCADDKRDDLVFIRNAREVLDAGDRVFYSSWW